MFYRLLRLKSWQRREIQNHERFVCRLKIEECIKDYFDLKNRLDDYEKVMIQHRIHTPYELFIALEGCQVKDDLTKTEFIRLRDTLQIQYSPEEIRKQLMGEQ